MTEEIDSFEDDASEELKSKTQVKQELKDITKLGKQLSELSISKLRELPLTENIIESFETLSAIKGNEGKKRHFKYIGKLLRSIDIKPVQAAYARYRKGQPLILNLESEVSQSTGSNWAERMIADSSASESFIEEHPNFDRQQLRQHLRNAKKSEKNKTKFVQFLEQNLDELN